MDRNILTGDEERALSIVREIVADLRTRGAPSNIEFIEQALATAGASKEDREPIAECRTFRLGGARFSVLLQPNSNGGVEVNFDPET